MFFVFICASVGNIAVVKFFTLLGTVHFVCSVFPRIIPNIQLCKYPGRFLPKEGGDLQKIIREGKTVPPPKDLGGL